MFMFIGVIRLLDKVWWGSSGRGGIAGAAWWIRTAMRLALGEVVTVSMRRRPAPDLKAFAREPYDPDATRLDPDQALLVELTEAAATGDLPAAEPIAR